MQNHFELFGLSAAYRLDMLALERAYRDIQARIHPDKFAHAGPAERRASMQWTTRVNEAYGTLRNPVQRAAYLLGLHGVDVAFESNTAMPADFLARQMELREALEAASGARDAAQLDTLRSELVGERRRLEAELAASIDERADYPAAAGLVRKLRFLEKLDAEIDAAHEAIEA